MTTIPDLPLAADFAQATQNDWRKLVDGVLKGAPFERLVGKTYDDLKISPIYARARGAIPIAGRAAAMPWQIMQRIDHPDPAQANTQALHELENGATGLTLVFAGANGARGFGLDPTPRRSKNLLDGVILDAGISMDSIRPASRMAGENLAALVEAQRVDPARLDVRFGHRSLLDACAVRGIAAAVAGRK